MLSQITPFLSIFDTREVLTNKASMEKFNPQAIRSCDVILVELFVHCYNIHSDKEKKKGGFRKKAQEWVKWCCFFELQAVSILLQAPESEESLDDEDDLDDEEF